MSEKKVVEGRVKLLNVRLSFAELFNPKPRTLKDGRTIDGKFKANGLIDKAMAKAGDLKGVYKGKTMPILEALKHAKHDAIAKKLGDEQAKNLKIRSSNYCVKDGDEENYDGYEGQFYISASNTEKVKVKGRDKRDLTAADGVIYSGCYVNMIVTMWYQQAGTKNGETVPHAVFASLDGVQFVRDGESFGAPKVDDDDFDDLTDDDDEINDDDVGGGDSNDNDDDLL